MTGRGGSRARHLGWLGVLLATLLATWARIALLRAGPDLDTDAYGHAVIGRLLLADWTNVNLHWVWLPAWHFVFAGFDAMGLGLDDVRFANIVASAFIPLVLCSLLEKRDHSSSSGLERAVPYLAGALCAGWPLALEHGQSAEPEAWFSLLLLGACWCVEAGRSTLAGLILGIAVLLRYEAWAVLPAFGASSLLHIRGGRNVLRESLMWLVPAAVIAAWCYAHYRASGEVFQFLRVNREFAQAARAAAPRGVGPDPSLGWYAFTLPRHQLGHLVLFAVPGALSLAKRGPRTFFWVGAALLAFVTYGWVRQLHLGLDRHFFALIPLYSAIIAAGPAEILRWIPAPRPFELRGRRVPLGMVVGAVTTLTVLGITARRAHEHVGAMTRAHENAFLAERRAAAVLTGANAKNIFCDLPRVEIFSRLPRSLFLRWAVQDVSVELARAQPGPVAVVSHPSRMKSLEGWGSAMLDEPDVRVMVDGRR